MKEKKLFTQPTFNAPPQLVSLRLLQGCLFLCFLTSPRKAHHGVVLVVYGSESQIKLMLMGADNTCSCCQYYYRAPIFQSVFLEEK